MPQCTAKSKRSHRRCRRSASLGRSVCASHGGKTPIGIASPNWKHGRYSQALPRGLLTKYVQAQGDPRWLSLRDELALTDARIQDLLERLAAGETSERWQAVIAAHEELEGARPAKDTGRMAEALRRLGEAIHAGRDDLAVSGDLTAQIVLRQRLVEAQSRMMRDLHHMLGLDHVFALIDAVAALVREHVKDAAALRAIQEGLTRLLRAPASSDGDRP